VINVERAGIIVEREFFISGGLWEINLSIANFLFGAGVDGGGRNLRLSLFDTSPIKMKPWKKQDIFNSKLSKSW
jgi:hypothetical protein